MNNFGHALGQSIGEGSIARPTSDPPANGRQMHGDVQFFDEFAQVSLMQAMYQRFWRQHDREVVFFPMQSLHQVIKAALGAAEMRRMRNEKHFRS